MELHIPTMLSISETAKLLHLSEYFVRQVIKTGKVKSVKSGKKYFVNVDSFVEWLNTSSDTEERQTIEIDSRGLYKIPTKI